MEEFLLLSHEELNMSPKRYARFWMFAVIYGGWELAEGSNPFYSLESEAMVSHALGLVGSI